MQETRQKFYELADALLRENGLLANRTGWIQLRQLVHDAHPDCFAADRHSLVYSLLLVLLSTPEKSTERTGKLATLIESACRAPLEEQFIDLLKQLAGDELTVTLLPQIYCADSRGSVAVYLAARTGLHIDAEAFQYFLTARSWEQTDLINLAFLVRPADQLKVSTILEQGATNDGSALNRETFTEFRHILFGQLPHTPLLPDTATIAAPVVIPALAIAEAPDPVAQPDSGSEILPDKPMRQTVHGARTKSPPSADAKHKEAPSAFITAFKKLIETNQSALFVLFLLTTIFLLATGISKWLTSDTVTRSGLPENAGKLPSHWTDATTREKITERHLAADKDYRMGELYLTRDRYSEALILFEDALATRPDHKLALYRAGYCRLHIKDYEGARTALEKALSIDPAIRHANLLLARTAAAQLDNRRAEQHFNRELELAKDPSVAEEYANFLHDTGKKAEAETLINTYQALYPDRILILTRKPANAAEKEQRQ